MIVLLSPALWQVAPKPVLSMLPYDIPIASVDVSANQMERELLASNLQLSCVRRNVTDSHTETLASETALAADRCALKLFQHALKVWIPLSCVLPTG